MAIKLTPLTPEERKTHCALFVGKVTCPFCEEEVLVVNDGGLQGDPFGHYIVIHQSSPQDPYFCEGSNVTLEYL